MKFFIAAYIGLIVALVSVVLGFIFGFAGIVLLAIIISLLFVLFVIAALQNILRCTVSDLRAITDALNRINIGELDGKVDATGTSEGDQASVAFSRMASSLQDFINNLAGERDQLSAIFDTMADGVLVIDSQRRVLVANQTAQKLLELDSSKVINAQFADLIRDHELQRVVSESILGRNLRQAELELLYQRRFIRATAIPLRESSGGGVLLTLHDLTKVRQLDTTRREFVSNVSHELRGPLASIKAMVETLESVAFSDTKKTVDFLHLIHGDIDRMTELINDLLELSRLESGHEQLHLTPLAIGPLCIELLEEIQADAEKNGIQLEVVVREDMPLVLSQDGKFRQVITNLLANSRKAMPNGGNITIEAEEKEAFIEISVSDTGIGIPKDHVPHIFERFYKVDRARRDGGTGLGLSIVKHIVQAHGGDITVFTEEGTGSKFVFTLPRAT